MERNEEWRELLDRKEYVRMTALLLQTEKNLYAATVGLDGRPQVRPASFAFESDGAFYFAALKNSRLYAELSQTPYVQFCVHDGEKKLTFRLSGKACFTEDPALIDQAADACPEILLKVEGDRKYLILFFLLEAEVLIEEDGAWQEERRVVLPDPSGVLIGITIKKKTELRDRIARVLERREAEPPELDAETAKRYDGALFVFAEAAKALWPRMDIQPVERAAVFETYDERETYTKKAAATIGNAVIDKPEDITYWLDPALWADPKD